MKRTLHAILALPVLAGGCAIHAPGEGGSGSTYVFGFGIVQSAEPSRADVSRTYLRVVGIAATGGAAGRWVAGYLEATDLVIGPQSPDLLLEVGCSVREPSIRRTIVRPQHDPCLALCGLLAGCATHGYSIIASTATTIGVGMTQNPANGALDATLGYKHGELAFVPTNRNGDEGSKDSHGNGARDSANVLMELRYSGIFSASGGIYQRLAVGDEAVRQSGAALMFAKGPDGSLDAAVASAAVMGIPAAVPAVEAAKVPMGTAFAAARKQNNAAELGKFDTAAADCKLGDFATFLAGASTQAEVDCVRRNLEAAGVKAR